MTWHAVLSRLRASFVSRRPEEDEAEIQGHLKLLAERFERQGMAREEAAFAAKKQFGGVTRTKENLRERRALLQFDVLLQDLKHAFRQVKRRSRLHRDCRVDAGAGNRRDHGGF
ncbi:MAG: permease prefix domain 1-containing protein [Bryobacteraceae bacterium]